MNKKIRYKDEIRRILLGLTLDCNMRCKYCYINIKKKRLSKERIDYILKNLIKNKGKHRKLIYLYGGEPLMAMDLVRYVIKKRNEIYKEYDIYFEIIIVTNGTILNEGIISILKKNNIKIMISISGRKKTNDKYRVFKNGQGTYDTILRNSKKILLELNKNDVWLSYTITPEMSKNLFEDILYFEKIGFKNFHIEPVLCQGYDWANYLKVFKKELQKFLDYLYSNALKKEYILFSVLNRQVEMLLGHFKSINYSKYNDLRIYPTRSGYNHFEMNKNYLHNYRVWDYEKYLAKNTGKLIIKNNLNDYIDLIIKYAI